MKEEQERVMLADIATRFRLLGFKEDRIREFLGKPIYQLLEQLDVLEVVDRELNDSYE